MVAVPKSPVWARLFASPDYPLTREVAEYLARFRFSDADNTRMEYLGERCQLGQLTEVERVEYEAFVEAGLAIGTWQSRARVALREMAADG